MLTLVTKDLRSSVDGSEPMKRLVAGTTWVTGAKADEQPTTTAKTIDRMYISVIGEQFREL